MSKGYQNFSTIGIQGSLGPLSFQVNPEFIFAQNLDYNYGVLKSTGTEYLERFGNGTYRTFLPGQSSVRLNAGAFSFGASTENIWWGPGQFNSLLFSNNAFGFEHLTLNTRRPARTFLGTFEGQVIMGKLEGSGFESPISNTLRRDWRYMNGINIVYGPKWVPGFFIGISRVYQQYSQTLGSSIRDYFPIFMGLQKEGLVGDSPDSGDFDQAGRDQQLTGYVRYVNPKAKIELYFEYGRRDHAWNWREAILNPEHARAYLFGFQKLINAPNDAHYQIRGEVLQQQESVNILVRYPNLGGGQNWGGHIPVRHGFTHRGQMLGPGIGPSSNVQTLEGAWVKGFKKLGLRLERLNRHQDIYQKRFLDPSEQGRWVDLSARLLADWQFDNLIISSNINFVNSLNYQWQLAPDSTPEFPRGENLFSLHSQVSLIYLFGKQP
ncbi:capsule assembly Wzi family protein [Belliella sp. DSM 111904]|uniref:Capsule assembly Wzi family protein n=1 Tax=Belliella filtrata TaxID=2923435 RepID=A0ABS9UZV2_9BACT|nr:capsule assembly Wzi family protein [Belliella filtrata]MCH7409691.1 capsule assembly Wzi family protein [Belliella filtrata]